MLKNLFKTLEEQTAGLDGSVSRDEFQPRSAMPTSIDVEKRDELNMFVLRHTTEAHTFRTSRGKTGIVYYDDRGRAGSGIVSEMSDEQILFLASQKGYDFAPPEASLASEPGPATEDVHGFDEASKAGSLSSIDVQRRINHFRKVLKNPNMGRGTVVSAYNQLLPLAGRGRANGETRELAKMYGDGFVAADYVALTKAMAKDLGVKWGVVAEGVLSEAGGSQIARDGVVVKIHPKVPLMEIKTRDGIIVTHPRYTSPLRKPGGSFAWNEAWLNAKGTKVRVIGGKLREEALKGLVEGVLSEARDGVSEADGFSVEKKDGEDYWFVKVGGKKVGGVSKDDDGKFDGTRKSDGKYKQGFDSMDDAAAWIAGSKSESAAQMRKELARVRSELAKEKKLWATLQKEFPDWALGDLRDAAGSTSSRMSPDGQEIQKRVQQLRKKLKMESLEKITHEDIEVIQPLSNGMWVIRVEDALKIKLGKKFTWKKPILKSGQNRLIYKWHGRKQRGRVMSPYFILTIDYKPGRDLFDVLIRLHNTSGEVEQEKKYSQVYIDQLTDPRFLTGWLK